jgi:rhodanese-related sulfurtransferase
MKVISKNIIYLFFLIFSSNGCLKDAGVQPSSVEFESSAELLTYLEENGDYINSSDSPSIINADEVYNNLNSYLILDVRSKYQFDHGHIENAINLKSENLINYLKEINRGNFTKVVIVSATGQAAAYYNCLLRLYGFTNTFSLNFGMASWNSDFSQLWQNSNSSGYRQNSFDNIFNSKPNYTKLPKISFENSDASTKEKLLKRILILLNEDFVDTTLQNVASGPSIDLGTITKNYNENKKIFEGYYFALYGDDISYYYSSKSGSEVPLHPKGAVFYKSSFPISELKSTEFLQTIPSDKIDVIYSFDGQLSAYAAAYLRVLGYDAKSQLFGIFWDDPFGLAAKFNFPYK